MNYNFNSPFAFGWNPAYGYNANTPANPAPVTQTPTPSLASAPPPGFNLNPQAIAPNFNGMYPYGLSPAYNPNPGGNWSFHGYQTNNVQPQQAQQPTQPPDGMLNVVPNPITVLPQNTSSDVKLKSENTQNSEATISQSSGVKEKIDDQIAMKVSSMLSDPSVLQSAIEKFQITNSKFEKPNPSTLKNTFSMSGLGNPKENGDEYSTEMNLYMTDNSDTESNSSDSTLHASQNRNPHDLDETVRYLDVHKY